ncbi:MAG TPA: methyltransferase domain-containing protein [Acidimicrobiia bacterium]|jgi:ubiquinone/menaquinone biosynthesis C-methylase UbiE|nr:methyltransferase domain-containing protein [Acidimicrobiia bacterium]
MTTHSYRNLSGSGAENYERYFVPTIATAVSADLLRVAGLQPGERVADIACGTGIIARRAAELVGPTGTVTAIDISEEMIDVAKSITPPTGRHIDWHVADAAALPLPDETYDVVLCQMGLMFMDDRSRAISEMRRVLNGGGRVVVNTPGTIQPAFELMERALTKHINSDLGGFVRVVFSLPDPELLASLLGAAGFADVSATTPTARLDLPAPAEFLWQYINLTPIGPFVAEAPESAKLAMEREVVDSWQPYVAEGRTIVEQPMVIARGVR